MQLERKPDYKSSSINPSCIKENNFNLINIFDTNITGKINNINGFKKATKLRRNFK